MGDVDLDGLYDVIVDAITDIPVIGWLLKDVFDWLWSLFLGLMDLGMLE